MKSAILTAADSMTFDDTSIGGEFRRFPTTRHSAIQELSSDDSSVRRLAADLIIRVYWKPVYKHIRIQWHKNNEDAKDLTQSFFTALLEKEYLKSFDASRGRFRTFLRTCLNRFMSNQAASAARIKRGGGIIEVSLDFAYAEEELLRSKELSPDHAEDYFNREWVRGIIAVSLERFRRECEEKEKSMQLKLFERYDLEQFESDNMVSYDTLANEFDIPVTTVTNYLAWARQEFRRLTLETIQQLTSSESEYRDEVRTLLGLKL